MVKTNLKVQNVVVKMGNKVILNNISFEMNGPGIYAFIGPNGSGKTSTIRTIVGLYKQNSGNIYVNNVDTKYAKSRKSLGYLPEKETFTRSKTHKWLLSLALLSGVKKENSLNMIKKLSKLFDIEKCMNMKMLDLSSGQRKKVLLIQAILHNPNFLIMDEPTENLDPDSRIEFYETITKLAHSGKTILISTHVLDEIGRYADYAIVIRNGKTSKVYTIARNVDRLKKIYQETKLIKKTNPHSVESILESSESKQSSKSENQLQEINRLLDKKLITKKEYNTKRKEILRSIK